MISKTGKLLTIAIAMVLALFVHLSVANVIGIDFGSDTMKVAIVQPGAPMEIVTNLQSKRKTPTAISFYRGERLFGADATAIIARKPDLTFVKMNRILGKSAEHPVVKQMKDQFYPYEIYRNETTGRTVYKQEQTFYSPEELIAMMMQYAKEITANYGGKVIKDCVLTVPSSFTQHERAAMYAAANIADLRVLSLIEENTAAALHYGIDRVFEEPHHVMYYNLGANSLQVTVVKYSSYTIKEAGKNKTIGQFEVVGKAWDSDIGLSFIDVKLAEILADRFNALWAKKKSYKGEDIRDFVRPMTRLRTEAVKIKEVLSANNEYPIKTEQLHADIDLITKVTRAELEEASKELLTKITIPVTEALEMASLKLEDVQAVELLGGGVRMPYVKRLLKEYFDAAKLELGQHLNGDEAMGLGAAFRAANISTAFRVRKVGLQDISSFGVSLKLETLSSKSGGFFGGLFGGGGGDKKADGPPEWIKQTSLYPRLSAVPSKAKTVAFNYDKDILCKIEYDDDAEKSLPQGASKLLAVYNITGVADFAKETESKGLGQPKVHLSFTLDSSGVVSLNKAEATVELPPEEPTAEEKAAAEAEAATEAEKAAREEEEAAAVDANAADADANADADADTKDGENSTDSTDSSETDSKTKKKDKKKEKKEKKKKVEKKDTHLRRTLTIEENPTLISPPAWSTDELAESRDKLAALDYEDRQRKAKEAALNELEGYVYKVKNRLMDDEAELSKVSTEEQRTTLQELVSVTSEWIDDEAGPNTELTVYREKLTDLKFPAEAMFKRLSELTDRPAAVAKAREQLVGVKTTVGKWVDTMPQVTDEEKSKLLDLVEKASTWIDDKEEAQSKKPAHEDPVFDSADVMPQLKTIGLTFEKLLRKPKPPPPKPSKNETVTVNGTNSTDGNETTAAATADAGDNEESEDVGDDSGLDDKKKEEEGEQGEESKEEL